ncbi:MAG: phospholipase D family protein [Candidatus Sabulitectum sp.]|nr:phospholipase D family protein [Candidatus Sabulitectum sp.]
MLSPDTRRLFTDFLSPPLGMVFSSGVAATYSLDILTLLAVPLQLALPVVGDSEITDGVALLDLLRRVTGSLRVFCERGRMLVPRENHILYSMLEEVVIEVDPPLGGSFHPKVWLLRFVDPSGDLPDVFRLMVSSRNITSDNSWDAAVVLDGKPGSASSGSVVSSSSFSAAASAPLTVFLRSLCGMAHVGVSSATASVVDSLASMVDSVEWELPPGCFALFFHLLGPGHGGWMPPWSSSLVVVSPFLSEWAVKSLAATSAAPLAVVSRTSAFTSVACDRFGSQLVLHEAAETDEGDDDLCAGEIGLHAKVYVYREWYNTHVVIGSANATTRALKGVNVEFMVEVVGKDRFLGKPDSFVAGFEDMLVDFTDDDSELVSDSLADEVLADVHVSLLGIPLSLKCVSADSGWQMELGFGGAVELPAGVSLSVWLVTMQESSAVAVDEIVLGGSVLLPCVAPESLTGFVAFSLKCGADVLRFSLNIPVLGMPEERSGFILRSVIRRSEDFLRYLMMLLSGYESSYFAHGNSSAFAAFIRRSSSGDLRLLENIVAALAADPAQLVAVDKLVLDLEEGASSLDIFPDGFLEFWGVFREMLESENL